MKLKKYIFLGIICLGAAILQAVSGIGIIFPYLAFCGCSVLIGENGRKGAGIAAILLTGLVALPIIELLYLKLTVILPASVFFNAVVFFVRMCIYLGVFFLVNLWVCKRQFRIPLSTGIPVVLCTVVYALLESVQALAVITFLDNAVEQGTLYGWLSGIGGSLWFGILTNLIFYSALWFASVSFLKE